MSADRVDIAEYALISSSANLKPMHARLPPIKVMRFAYTLGIFAAAREAGSGASQRSGRHSAASCPQRAGARLTPGMEMIMSWFLRISRDVMIWPDVRVTGNVSGTEMSLRHL